MRRVPFKNYDVHWCLAAAKRHGVGVLVKKGLKTPIRVSRTLDVDDAVDDGGAAAAARDAAPLER